MVFAQSHKPAQAEAYATEFRFSLPVPGEIPWRARGPGLD